MLQLRNDTPFEGAILPLPDQDGVDSLVTIVKGTFELSRKPEVLPEPLPLTLADEYFGEPGTSGLDRGTDIAFAKGGTDVVVRGTARVPSGRKAEALDVTLSLGPVRKTVRVFGDRCWERGLVGHKISSAEPFESMPLVWERAFGGIDPAEESENHATGEARNPVGRGIRAKKGGLSLDGLPLPNLEDPSQPISSWKDRPTPACFGFVAPNWRPRRDFVGTYDEDWKTKRAPFLPRDFDARFFRCAPADQFVDGHLEGGEEGELRHVTPEGKREFRLPAVRVQIDHRIDGATETEKALLDTVVLEPDHGRMTLTWRSVLSCDKRTLRIREVIVRAEGVGALP